MRVHNILYLADMWLSRFPVVIRVAETLSIRPAFVPCIGLVLVSMFLGVFDGLITNMVGFLYPAWQSFKAIETPESRDDRQWLTYWVVYACFALVEIFSDTVLFWVPFYYLCKLAFLLWLALPQFQGAAYLYATVLRPILLSQEAKIDMFLNTVASKVAHATHPRKVDGAAKTD